MNEAQISNACFSTAIIGCLVLMLDYLQTLKIARNPDKWYETNFVLGKHPSVNSVHIWFAMCTGFLVAINLIWQNYWILAYNSIVCIFELWYVLHNMDKGIEP